MYIQCRDILYRITLAMKELSKIQNDILIDEKDLNRELTEQEKDKFEHTFNNL